MIFLFVTTFAIIILFFSLSNDYKIAYLIHGNKKNIQSKIYKKPELINSIANNKFIQPGWILNLIGNTNQVNKLIISSGCHWNIFHIKIIQQLFINILVIIFVIGLIFSTSIITLTFRLAPIFLLVIYTPLLILKIRANNRKKILQKEIPYIIDMLSMCVSSGMNIEQSFFYIGNKLHNSIGKEFKKLSELIQLGIPFEKALARMQKYIPISEYKNLIASIIQSKKLGTSLSRTLDIQSEMIRTRRRQKAEHLSRTATVKITIPLVLFIFPALLIIYLAPGLLQLIQ